MRSRRRPVRQAVRRALPAALEEAPEERRRRGRRALGEHRVEERLPLRDDGRGGVGVAGRARGGPRRGGGGGPARGRAAGWRRRRPAGSSCGTKRPLMPSSICCRAPLSGVATVARPASAGLGDDMRHALAARQPDEDVEGGEEARHVRPVAEEAEACRRGRGWWPAPRSSAAYSGMKASGPPMTRKRAAGLGGADEGGGAEEVLDPLLAVEAADPADQRRVAARCPRAARTGPRAAGSNSAGSTIEGISTAWCSRSGIRAAAASRMLAADADVAGGEMLRAGERLGDEAAVLDQRRAEREALERRVDVGDVLAGDDEVVAGQAAGEVGDRVLEGQRRRRWCRRGRRARRAARGSGRACPPCGSRGGRRCGSAADRGGGRGGGPRSPRRRPRARRRRRGCGSGAGSLIGRRRSAGTRAARRTGGGGSRRPRRRARRG